MCRNVLHFYLNFSLALLCIQGVPDIFTSHTSLFGADSVLPTPLGHHTTCFFHSLPVLYSNSYIFLSKPSSILTHISSHEPDDTEQSRSNIKQVWNI